MPTTYKILGQVAPAANTATTLYTVPSGNATVISSLTVCNAGTGGNANVSVQCCVANATTATSQFLVNNNTLVQNDTLFLTLGVTLAATDTLRVTSTVANVAFQVFGSEIS
jgi:hypothetical protein